MSAFSELVTRAKPQSTKLLVDGKVGAFKVTYEDGTAAVVKPAVRASKRGCAAPNGIPMPLVPGREVAFYEVAKLMKVEHLVPETVAGKFRGKPASFQKWVTACATAMELAPELATLSAPDVEDGGVRSVIQRALGRHLNREDALALVALDFVAASRDRHLSNLGFALDIGPEGKAQRRLVAWDNGASFGLRFTRYHSVLHRYLFNEQVSNDILLHFRRLDKDDIRELPALSEASKHHLWLRAQFALTYPHRLPWDAFYAAGGIEGERYAAFFSSVVGKEQRRRIRALATARPTVL